MVRLAGSRKRGRGVRSDSSTSEGGSEHSGSTWACARCTLVNEPESRECAACGGTPPPRHEQEKERKKDEVDYNEEDGISESEAADLASPAEANVLKDGTPKKRGITGSIVGYLTSKSDKQETPRSSDSSNDKKHRRHLGLISEGSDDDAETHGKQKEGKGKGESREGSHDAAPPSGNSAADQGDARGLGPVTFYCDSEEEEIEGPRLDLSKKKGMTIPGWWLDRKLKRAKQREQLQRLPSVLRGTTRDGNGPPSSLALRFKHDDKYDGKAMDAHGDDGQVARSATATFPEDPYRGREKEKANGFSTKARDCDDDGDDKWAEEEVQAGFGKVNQSPKTGWIGDSDFDSLRELYEEQEARFAEATGTSRTASTTLPPAAKRRIVTLNSSSSSSSGGGGGGGSGGEDNCAGGSTDDDDFEDENIYMSDSDEALSDAKSEEKSSDEHEFDGPVRSPPPRSSPLSACKQSGGIVDLTVEDEITCFSPSQDIEGGGGGGGGGSFSWTDKYPHFQSVAEATARGANSFLITSMTQSKKSRVGSYEQRKERRLKKSKNKKAPGGRSSQKKRHKSKRSSASSPARGEFD